MASSEWVLRPLSVVLWPLLRPVSAAIVLEALPEGEPLWLAHAAERVGDALLRLVKKAQRLLVALVLLLVAVPVTVWPCQLGLVLLGLSHLLVSPLLPPLWPVL